jgi:hypothetical protein
MTSLFEHPAVRCPKQPLYRSQGLSVSIQVYLTDRHCSEEYTPTESPWAFCAPPNVSVSIGYGKPCFGHILETEKESQVGAMAVSVCGPGGMGDDVRSSVRTAQGGKVIDLYEETFSW